MARNSSRKQHLLEKVMNSLFSMVLCTSFGRVNLVYQLYSAALLRHHCDLSSVERSAKVLCSLGFPHTVEKFYHTPCSKQSRVGYKSFEDDDDDSCTWHSLMNYLLRENSMTFMPLKCKGK